MDTTSFNQVIKDFYRLRYNINYNKDVEITYEEDGDLFMFVCKMVFNQPDRPLTLMGQYASLGGFTHYVLKDLLERCFPLNVKYFTLIQTDGIEGPPITLPIIPIPTIKNVEYREIVVNNSYLWTESDWLIYLRNNAVALNIDADTGQLVLTSTVGFPDPQQQC